MTMIDQTLELLLQDGSVMRGNRWHVGPGLRAYQRDDGEHGFDLQSGEGGVTDSHNHDIRYYTQMQALALFRTADELIPWGDLDPATVPAFAPIAHRHPWGELDNVPSSFAPSAHAASHAVGGSDPLSLGWGQVSKAGSKLEDFDSRSATALNSGTLADARLGPNIPRLSVSNTFTERQLYQGGAAGTVVLVTRVSTDTIARGTWAADGERQMGPGGAANRDLRERRSGVSTLTLDTPAGGAATLVVSGALAVGGVAAPNAHAVAEFASTAKGILPPRMTTAQRDAVSATPTPGLTLYNLDAHKLQTWNGSAWMDHF